MTLTRSHGVITGVQLLNGKTSVMYLEMSIRPGIHGVIIYLYYRANNPEMVSDILGYCPMCSRPYVYSRGEEGEGCEISN